MSPAPLKTPWYGLILDRLLAPKTLFVLLPLLGLGGGGAAMKALADVGMVNEDTARHLADSTVKANLAPLKAAVDSCTAHQERTDKRLEKLQEIQQSVFGAMMDADPKLKAAVKARAEQSQDAERKKAEDAKLLNDLTGGSP